ncbi:rod shape-determining protein MreD [Bacillus lacus]|uniref:Rod shape-determining protein MreD n=1 Tax=Metabacillus lacus TaxID=1983721 RepID=A0A7X2LY53_9BACI|nr:rod shape-determining protein MreD [Metabacillus lacus]
MNKYLLPLFMLILFIAESVFTDLIAVPFSSDNHIFVPRFVLLALTFITAFVNRRYGILYGFAFGLLHDIVYTEVIGIYLFAYPLFAYLLAKVFKILHNNVLVVLFMGLLAISVLEFYVYGIHTLIRPTPYPFQEFTTQSLLPSLGVNLFAAILLILPARLFLETLDVEHNEE